MFYEDAAIASKLLNLTLTKRQNIPMAGIPCHAVHHHISKLLAAGKKIAICDQTGPAKAGEFARRQITSILIPASPCYKE
ncbi:hypothetical protein OH491_24690 [Termitidicoccus mucosus]|uniref:DNA mismatch repair protein MutS-like N-terminal domain-containing protein n=1 Tax=Termitidicoccus mucosus TaxID=1184151 RepID=A0A178IPR0_9BACT|nr:hypothetical protein AW736_01820 [Opitutaceae bacterium TSB47]